MGFTMVHPCIFHGRFRPEYLPVWRIASGIDAHISPGYPTLPANLEGPGKRERWPMGDQCWGYVHLGFWTIAMWIRVKPIANDYGQLRAQQELNKLMLIQVNPSVLFLPTQSLLAPGGLDIRKPNKAWTREANPGRYLAAELSTHGCCANVTMATRPQTQAQRTMSDTSGFSWDKLEAKWQKDTKFGCLHSAGGFFPFGIAEGYVQGWASPRLAPDCWDTEQKGYPLEAGHLSQPCPSRCIRTDSANNPWYMASNHWIIWMIQWSKVMQLHAPVSGQCRKKKCIQL